MSSRTLAPLCAVVAALLLAALSSRPGKAFDPTPPPVDFAHDVRPIFQQNCVSCHGPLKQQAGLRLDRRSSALKPLARRVVPGNSANSMLFHRVSDTLFGPPMPAQKPLRPAEIATLKAWIDQGAPWPDALANEADLPPIDPAAVAAVELLRTGQRPAFLRAVTAQPALLNARGPEGSTPFMYATLYADAHTLIGLLGLGADPNAHNDAGVTALHWAAHDLAKTTVLLAHGADPNVTSADFRTPLMIAARTPGSVSIVRLLLDHHANPNPNDIAAAQSSPLLEAATAGDPATFALLLDRGATLDSDAEQTLVMAATTGCQRCLQLAAAGITDKSVFTSALQDAAYLDDPASIRLFLDHGANPKAFDSLGRTALMSAVVSDVLSLPSVQLLVDNGADINATSRHARSGDDGLSILDLARMHGPTPIVDYLVAAGAHSSSPAQVALHYRTSAPDLNVAIRDSLPLVQHADQSFAKNSGCISCHNNSLTGMTVSMARQRGFPIDEKIATSQLHVNADFLNDSRDHLHQGFFVPVGDNFSDNIVAYALVGLHAEHHPADLNTDAAAMHILWRQLPSGEFPYPHADTRQPLCLLFLGGTALDLRALQLYAPAADPAPYRAAVRRAAAWLAQAKSYNNEDRSWRVIGLAWAGTNRPATRRAIHELEAAQKPDGGWSDLPSMESSAYSTGKSLVALQTAGVPTTSPAYQRGVRWLLTHQQQDGSWFVPTRALGFQPFADTGFPHGVNQFISTAGTNWAAMALTLALPKDIPTLTSTR